MLVSGFQRKQLCTVHGIAEHLYVLPSNRARYCALFKQQFREDDKGIIPLGDFECLVVILIETYFNCSNRISPQPLSFLVEGYWIVHNGSRHIIGAIQFTWQTTNSSALCTVSWEPLASDLDRRSFMRIHLKTRCLKGYFKTILCNSVLISLNSKKK